MPRTTAELGPYLMDIPVIGPELMPVRPMGTAIVIPTGGMASGKTSVVELLTHKGVRVLTGDTTRGPRGGDVPEEFDYHPSREAFLEAIPPDDLLQGAPPDHGTGDLYGQRLSRIAAALASGRPHARPLAPKTAIQMALAYREEVGGRRILPVRGLLLPTPPEELQIERALARGDTPDRIRKRLADEAKWDMALIGAGVEAGLLVRAEPGSSVAELAD